DSSPMGLLWTFMGFSKPYTVFAGLSETIGGVLLFFRRTATLGAMILVAVIGNIVLMNFSYDVPVKIFSSNLLLMALFLLAPDLSRIANVVVLNRPVGRVHLGSVFPRGWPRVVGNSLKIIVLGYFLYSARARSLEQQKTWGDNAPKGPLHGLYEVEDFVKNQQPISPLLTEVKRWRKVVIDRPGFAAVKF